MNLRARVLVAVIFWSSATTSHCAQALLEAVSRNDEAAVGGLLRNGADPNERFAGTTALHLAAEWGFAGMTELLLKTGAKSDAIDNYQRTPLIWAALNSHSDVARLLIAAGGDVNWRDEEGNSALSGAAAGKDRPLVKLLLSSGARISPDDGTALRKAIDVGDDEMVRLFIEAGANPCFHPGNDITKFTAAGEGKSLEVVKILASAATSCSTTRTLLSDIFTAAAKNGHLQSVEYLLPLVAAAHDKESEAAKYSKNAMAEALAAAVQADHFEVAKFLLEKATDLSPQQRGAPLAGTLKHKQSAMFHLLLDHGAALDERDDSGRTLLLQCALDGDFENAKFLIERGASVKTSATHSTTPLIAAGQAGSVPLVELFLQHGATCRDLDEEKRGPLLIAAMEGRADVCRVLLQHRCDPNVIDPANGFTALHYAASRCDARLVETLLFSHAHRGLKDKRSRTARDVAEESGATEVVELLSQVTGPGERRARR